MPHLLLMVEQVRQRAREFDVLHFHVEPPLHFSLFRSLGRKTVTTLHGRLDIPDLQPLYREFRDMPVVSISDSQRRPLPGCNWVGTVYHGLAQGACPFNSQPRGSYFAFLGRVAPEKGLDRAIAIVRRAGVRLRIAAKIDMADERYHHQRIVPLLRHPLMEFVGEVAEADKAEFLGNATGLLFPIDWPEPFGLALIEAMSCGTPVIAWPHGAVPEIVDHGVTGYVVNSIDEAVAAVKHIGRLERSQVRARFEDAFRREELGTYALALDPSAPGGSRISSSRASSFPAGECAR